VKLVQTCSTVQCPIKEAQCTSSHINLLVIDMDHKEAKHPVVSKLGQAVRSISTRFSCGGRLDLSPNGTVMINYKIKQHTTENDPCTSTGLVATAKETEEMWSSIKLPVASEAAMSKLLDACLVASFGYKDKNVTDKGYRDALCLDPTSFSTSFQLCATPIIKQIESIVPNCASGGLQAELYKLNIYPPGGFFKPHVDTPRSGNMFGSLVVCLPSLFGGGELVVRHQDEVIKYNWSSTTSDPSTSLSWAMFFSDIEHEVLPVTQGYRVTLTYNLHYCSTLTSLSNSHIKDNPFCKMLQAALVDPSFMPNGGILGFNCHYSYVFDIHWDDLMVNAKFTGDKTDIIKKLEQIPTQQFVCSSTAQQKSILQKIQLVDADVKEIQKLVPSSYPMLKGTDYIVFSSAKLLGLPVHVKPLLNFKQAGMGYPSYPHKYALKDFSTGYAEAQADCRSDCPYGQLVLIMFGKDACQYNPDKITWCEPPQYNQPAGAISHFGNEMMVSLSYKAGVLLIGIPEWSKSRQKVTMGTVRVADDNVERCFKKIRD